MAHTCLLCSIYIADDRIYCTSCERNINGGWGLSKEDFEQLAEEDNLEEE